MKGKYIVNERGKVLDVQGGVDSENRNVIVHPRHAGVNQHWEIMYVDKMKAEPRKGQLNHRFGMYVERPFYIVSRFGK